jgi:hypothetical protein
MSLTSSAAWLAWIATLPGAAPPPAAALAKPRIVVDSREATPPAPRRTQPAASGRELFVSWGYNGDRYAKSDIRIRQSSLGNDFTLAGVQARDSKGWTDLFNHSLTVPQYNVRFGMFFNEQWGAELALDHIKWIVRQDQQVRMTGTLNGEPVDAQVTLTPDVLRYQLNNGANPIFINAIRRIRLLREPGRTGHVALLLKGGGGFAVPHTENTVFGQPNDKGFQPFRGWNLDAVAAVRIDVFGPIYFEAEEKLLYARYFGVKVDRGDARHSVKANALTFSFGWAFR